MIIINSWCKKIKKRQYNTCYINLQEKIINPAKYAMKQPFLIEAKITNEVWTWLKIIIQIQHEICLLTNFNTIQMF